MVPIFCLLYAVRIGARARGLEEEIYGSGYYYRKLSRLTALTYGIGICSLWACIALTAAPPPSGGQEAAFRWVAFAIAIAASLVEVWFTRLQVADGPPVTGYSPSGGRGSIFPSDGRGRLFPSDG
jgi:hypothetical protein